VREVVGGSTEGNKEVNEGKSEEERMRVLVTFAVEAEFRPWRRIRCFRVTPHKSLPIWSTKIEGSEITVLLTGMGDSPARGIELMLREACLDRCFDVCVSSGLAGALRATHPTGEVFVAEHLKTYRIHADLGKDCLEADKTLVELAVACGAKRVSTLYTASHVLNTAQEKASLAESADVVDMESFDIVKEGYAWGARGIAVRAVSDGASEDLPIDFNRTLSTKKAISLHRVLIELVKKPGALPSLIQFGKQSQRAAERLAEFLDEFMKQICKLRVVPTTGGALTE
jgi:nucleoside phosphorylase